jgi:hypothetical protein
MLIYQDLANKMEESMTPTAWEFRNKLTAILNEARHNGEPHVDVESGNLHTELGGDPKSDHRMPIYHEVMTRMMRPGDSILDESRTRNGATMLIRYILKAKHEQLKNDFAVTKNSF